MKVLIGRTVGTNAEPITNAIKASGIDMVIYDTDLAGVSDQLRREPACQCLVCSSRPEYALANAMSLGEEVPALVDEWAAQARAAVDLYVENRSKCLLVDCLNVAARPKEFYALLEEWLGVSIDGKAGAAVLPAPKAVPTYAVLAAQWPVNSPSVAELAGRLEACAHPLGDGAPEYTSAPGNAYTLYRELVEDDSGTGNTKELEEENELLILQLHQVQEELERYYLETIDLKDDLSKAKDRLKTTNVLLSESEESAKGERERLSSQLRNVQRDLLRSKRDNDLARQQIRQLAKYALSMERMVDHFVKSTSWRLTAPIRVIRRIIKRVLRRKRVSRTRFPERPDAMRAYGPAPVGRSRRRKR